MSAWEMAREVASESEQYHTTPGPHHTTPVEAASNTRGTWRSNTHTAGRVRVTGCNNTTHKGTWCPAPWRPCATTAARRRRCPWGSRCTPRRRCAGLGPRCTRPPAWRGLWSASAGVGGVGGLVGRGGLGGWGRQTPATRALGISVRPRLHFGGTHRAQERHRHKVVVPRKVVRARAVARRHTRRTRAAAQQLRQRQARAGGQGLPQRLCLRGAGGRSAARLLLAVHTCALHPATTRDDAAAYE